MNEPDTPTRVIVEECGPYWRAWFENRPEVAFGGRTATEAAFRLTGPVESDPVENAQTWRDRPAML